MLIFGIYQNIREWVMMNDLTIFESFQESGQKETQKQATTHILNTMFENVGVIIEHNRE